MRSRRREALHRALAPSIGFVRRPPIEANLIPGSFPARTCVKKSIGFDRALFSTSILECALRPPPVSGLPSAQDLGLRVTRRSSCRIDHLPLELGSFVVLRMKPNRRQHLWHKALTTRNELGSIARFDVEHQPSRALSRPLGEGLSLEPPPHRAETRTIHRIVTEQVGRARPNHEFCAMLGLPVRSTCIF
jgi:hypothetical protein